jgi:hypothetical protein
MDSDAGIGAASRPRARMPAFRALTLVITESGGIVYVGGNFTQVGPPTGSFVAIDESTAAATLTWLGINGSVTAITPDDAGGDFTAVGDAGRNYVAALDGNGFATAWNANLNGSINALLATGDALYAGGIFSSVNNCLLSSFACFEP